MINFKRKGFFARLKKLESDAYGETVDDLLVGDEFILSAYRSVCNGVVFTNKRIIAINIQGITGKKKDCTSIPYSKIASFSLESAGIFDHDSELQIFISGLGKVSFEFTQPTDVKEICKTISSCALA